MSDRLEDIKDEVSRARGVPVGTRIEPTQLIRDVEWLIDELERSRRWARAWKAAAWWRYMTGHHHSRAWHERRRP